MLKKLFLLAVLVTAFVSCKSKKAFNLSEDITAKEQSLEPDIKATEEAVGRYGAAQQFDSVAYVSEKMEKKVQTKIDEIEAMKVPDATGAQEFHDEAVVYFKFIKKMYTGYKNVGLAKTDEERQAIAVDLQKLVDEKNDVMVRMQAAQRKYADANGFKIK